MVGELSRLGPVQGMVSNLDNHHTEACHPGSDEALGDSHKLGHPTGERSSPSGEDPHGAVCFPRPRSPVPAGLHLLKASWKERWSCPAGSPSSRGGGRFGGFRCSTGQSAMMATHRVWLCGAQPSLPHLVSPPPGPSWSGSCFPKQGLCQIASHSLSSDSSQSYSGNKGLEERSGGTFFWKEGSKLGPHLSHTKKHGNSLVPGKAGLEAPCVKDFSQLWR